METFQLLPVMVNHRAPFLRETNEGVGFFADELLFDLYQPGLLQLG